MKIYTKTGDKGETGLMGGKRVAKDSLRIKACGDVDELNSALGVCRSHNTNDFLESALHRLQRELFLLGADLSTPRDEKVKVPRIEESHIAGMEQLIDRIDGELKPLTNFIVPGGSKTASFLHLARAVCRRSERAMVTLRRVENVGEYVVIYVNRLSDLLFVMARYANLVEDVDEEKCGGT